jgi:uncharacterized damage-inducible protein DinB
VSAFRSLYKYKAWANSELFPAVATVDAAAQPKEVETMIRTLNHIYVVDQIFRAHLLGQPHGFAAANTPELPTLDALHFGASEVDAWYCDYVDGVSASELAQPLRFQFTDGDRGEMTREEMLHHVLAHGAYHRGNVGQVMKSLGIAPPRDLFTKFLHLSEPARRVT